MRRLGLLVVVFAVLTGCAGEESGRQGGDTAVDSTGSAASEGVALEGETLDGKPLSLGEFRGTPVFVNVWASW
jgi:hypothetical protein